MEKYLLTFGLPIFISVAISLLAKFLPKQKIIDWTTPFTIKAAKAIDFLLLSKFTSDTAEKLEEGVFITIADVIIENLKVFTLVLRVNNKDRENEML